MNVLVTGPFGTVGRSVVARLLGEGHVVTCFDLATPANRKHASALGDRVRVLFGDVTRTADVDDAVRGQAAVVHLAAMIPPASELAPERSQSVNVGGTRNVVDAIARLAPDAVLIFASSVSVHGYSRDRTPPCRVDTPLDAKDHYARQKIECEAHIRASGIRFVILRLGACAAATDRDKGGDPKEALRALFALAADTRVEYLHPEGAATAIEHAVTTESRVRPDVSDRKRARQSTHVPPARLDHAGSNGPRGASGRMVR